MIKGIASEGVSGMDARKGAMPWSEEYPESHVRQLNAPRGVARELTYSTGYAIELAYSLCRIFAPGIHESISYLLILLKRSSNSDAEARKKVHLIFQSKSYAERAKNSTEVNR